MDVDKVRNNLKTLENYTERYLPLQILKILTNLLNTITDEEQLKKLGKQKDKMYTEL